MAVGGDDTLPSARSQLQAYVYVVLTWLRSYRVTRILGVFIYTIMKIITSVFVYCSCRTSLGADMISRRRILSRSRDDLSLHDPAGFNPEEEEDVWYNKDKLYKVSQNHLFVSSR